MTQRLPLCGLMAALLALSVATAHATPTSEVRLVGNGTKLQLTQTGQSQTKVYGAGPSSNVRINNNSANIVVHFGSCPPGMAQTPINATGPDSPLVHVAGCVPKN